LIFLSVDYTNMIMLENWSKSYMFWK